MPPQVDETPSALKPFKFHGMELTKKTSEQHSADCPFCGKEGKFYVSETTSKWDCKVCGKYGNSATFISLLWKVCDEATAPEDYHELAGNRGLIDTDVLIHWGVCKSVITGEWLVPAYTYDGKLCQLYRYVRIKNKRRLLATPEMNHGLFGASNYDPSKPRVMLCEGPWDAMILWEALANNKLGLDGKNTTTGNPSASLLKDINVLAVPGCNVFQDVWLSLFTDKEVTIIYDNDHPKKHPTTGTMIEGASYSGIKRVVNSLAHSGDGIPSSVHYLQWGVDGFNPDLPSGYDLRDFLGEVTTHKDRGHKLHQFESLIKPVDREWVTHRPASRGKGKNGGGSVEIVAKPCHKWKTLQTAFKKAMKWSPGLDRALSVMLASITSTKAIGDQLWIKVIGPASCGKSTLCEAVSVAKKYVVAKSTIRGFHSGFQTDRAGKEDNSLISQLYDKTLVTKDGDTLLQSPNLGQILSEARDIYDRVSRTHYRNRMSRDYEGVSMTWLLCGTSSLRSIDSSELGERFLDCVIMEGIDDDMEDEVLLRVANRTARNMGIEAGIGGNTQDDPAMVEAQQLTGGYVHFLRENASGLLGDIKTDDESLLKCGRMGKFVSYMRARPSSKQDETAEREFAARLTSQLVRLATCLAVVLNRDSLDEEVLSRVRAVALDTSRGKTLEISRHLYEAGRDGLDVRTIALYVNDTEGNIRTLLRFLGRIGAVEHFKKRITAGLNSKPRWRLAERVSNLYRQVVNPVPTSVVDEEEEDN